MPPPKTARNARYRPTQEQARDLVTWWQERLNLQHWGIKVEFDKIAGLIAETKFPNSGMRCAMVFDLTSDILASPDYLQLLVLHEFIH